MAVPDVGASEDELYATLFPPGTLERDRRVLDDKRAGELELAFAQVAARRKGQPAWRFLGEDDQWERRRDDELWLRLEYDGLPGALISVRLQPSREGLTCSAVLVERDGRQLTSRDLRALRLGPIVEWARTTAYRSYVESFVHERARTARPGRPGYGEEHWTAVRERYAFWSKHDPQRVIKRMREEYPERERPSDATMRRWVQRVRTTEEGSADEPQ